MLQESERSLLGITLITLTLRPRQSPSAPLGGGCWAGLSAVHGEGDG
jgi:hypothetical protein